MQPLIEEGNAGTTWDAVLTTAASQIGQILLTLPNAFAKTGLIAGLVLSISSACMSLWTMFMLIALYVERKQRLMDEGKWFDREGKRAIITQYHEVIGDLLGRPAQVTVQIIIIISLVGTNSAQIVASASDAYYLDSSRSKREWALIWGACCMLAVFLPTLRHFRVINVVAIAATTYTAWYIVISAAQHGVTPGAALRGPLKTENFFVGASVMFSAFGGHAMALEIMDAMWQPEGYSRAYLYAWIISIQLAYPDMSLQQGNVYGVLPRSSARSVSIVLMLLHQIVAFCLYSTPLYYMWEKFIGTHTKPLWIRLPTRLPVTLFIWVLALAFPFQGVINSVIGAITSPAIAFFFPALAWSWIYRTAKARNKCMVLPPRLMRSCGSWALPFLLNAFIIVFYFVAGTCFGIFYSLKALFIEVHQFKLFAERAVVFCQAKQSSQNAAAATAAALLLAVSSKCSAEVCFVVLEPTALSIDPDLTAGPAIATPVFDVADVTGTEQSSRTRLGPNEVDVKDLESYPNASKKDAAAPPIQEVAKPGPKQAPKPVPTEFQSGRTGSSSTSGKPKAGKTGGGGGEGTALIGSAGPKDSNKALDGFFARLRGGK
eukprot:jgi/Astpho2/8628/Aster-05103